MERRVDVAIVGAGTAGLAALAQVRKATSKLPRHDLLEAVWGLISTRFLYQDRIDEQKIAQEVAKAIVGQLEDPYSAFMPPRQASNFKKHLQGELSGIGAQVESSGAGGVMVF